MMALPASVAALIDAAADRYSVPRTLARGVAWIESRGNTMAKSQKGAIGVMQLMPATAAQLKVDPFDPAANIDGGVRYLSQLLARYGERAGLAAYNWGPGHVASKPLEKDWPTEVLAYVTNVLQRAEYELATLNTINSGSRTAAVPLVAQRSSPSSADSSSPPLSSQPGKGRADDT